MASSVKPVLGCSICQWVIFLISNPENWQHVKGVAEKTINVLFALNRCPTTGPTCDEDHKKVNTYGQVGMLTTAWF